MSLKQKIIDEIVNKVEDYETNQATFLGLVSEWSDLFTVKKPLKKAGTFSRPRTPEMFRAVNALSTTIFRMITANDPFFSCKSLDPANSEEALYKIEKTIQTQLRYSQYKRYLLKSLMQTVLMGTSIVEETFEWMTINPLGRKIPITHFVPRSLLQVGFDRNCFDIDKSDWLYTTDRTTQYNLKSMAANDAGGSIWSKGDIQDAIAEKGVETTNEFILNRLSGENNNNTETAGDNNHMELTMFYGKLDTLNDGIEYVCGLINRKYIVRFHENKDQSGRKNFRVSRWIEWELRPQSVGVGELLAGHQRAIDSNRQKVETGITFNNLNMWLKDRGAGINAQAFKLIPLKIIEGDGTNGVKPLETSGVGIVQGLKLDEILKSEFRTASGATDTLQGIPTGGTLGEVSLIQNEAFRNVSVKAELIAESVSRQHLEQTHINNYSCVGEKFIISGSNGPMIVYPSDMKVDVDFEITMSTDKNFRPGRAKDLAAGIQMLTSIRNDGLSSVAKPIVLEWARTVDIDPKLMEAAYKEQEEKQQAMMQQAADQAVQKFQLSQAEALAKSGAGNAPKEAVQEGVVAKIPVKGPDVSGSVNQPQEVQEELA